LKSKSGIKRKWLTGQSEHTFQWRILFLVAVVFVTIN
jgi:hypothetical protein